MQTRFPWKLLKNLKRFIVITCVLCIFICYVSFAVFWSFSYKIILVFLLFLQELILNFFDFCFVFLYIVHQFLTSTFWKLVKVRGAKLSWKVITLLTKTVFKSFLWKNRVNRLVGIASSLCWLISPYPKKKKKKKSYNSNVNI